MAVSLTSDAWKQIVERAVEDRKEDFLFGPEVIVEARRLHAEPPRQRAHGAAVIAAHAEEGDRRAQNPLGGRGALVRGDDRGHTYLTFVSNPTRVGLSSRRVVASPAKGASPIDVLHASATGLVQVFAWPTFGLMLIGMALGFVVGLLPGLGGPTTLALMLPFVFKMTPIEAFAFLLGMLAVTATTGDITSILFGIPGEPTTAATIVDGHAMARNGEAGRALGAAMMSSLVGAVFGALVLGLAIPIIRPLVLTLERGLGVPFPPGRILVWLGFVA